MSGMPSDALRIRLLMVAFSIGEEFCDSRDVVLKSGVVHKNERQ